MNDWLGLYGTGIVMTIATVALSVAGLVLARRFMSIESLRSCHDVASALLSVVGTMYAVLLGLVVVDAMSRFQQGIAITEQEANSLADVFLLAESFPKEKQNNIQRLCRTYATLVVETEWKEMDCQRVCGNARKTAIQLMRAVEDFEPTTEREKAIFPIAVSEVCELWDNRRARTNMSTHGIPSVEWAVLVVGGIVTIVFTYFFGLESTKAQIGMTSMVATVIALNMYLVVIFGYPFSGALKVNPDAFLLDKKIFDDQLGFSQNAAPSGLMPSNVPMAN